MLGLKINHVSKRGPGVVWQKACICTISPLPLSPSGVTGGQRLIEFHDVVLATHLSRRISISIFARTNLYHRGKHKNIKQLITNTENTCVMLISYRFVDRCVGIYNVSKNLFSLSVTQDGLPWYADPAVCPACHSTLLMLNDIKWKCFQQY